MLDREPTLKQRECNHSYVKIPKSGQILGNLAWRCVYCERFVETT